MELSFRIGSRTETVSVDDERVLGILEPDDLPEGLDEEALVKVALANPVGSRKLSEIVGADETVAIVTSDITRPCPTWKILPSVLDELYRAGVKKENITLVFGLGSHRHQTEEEMIHLAGEKAYSEITCVDSYPDDTFHVGTTERGTPIDIDRRVMAADRRICIGNVEYHYFAGYSGGAKAIMPGVSTRDAIQYNHRHMVKPDSCAGRLEGNPVREDIEEAAAKVGVDFIVNVVLNTRKEIVCAEAGDVTAAHRKACAYLDSYYRREIDEQADIVIVSQGGAPKDLNLYQTQKALDNAKHAVRAGGAVILCGSCAEGFGESHFEEWMLKYTEPHDMVEEIQRNFILGAHKAAAIAMVREKADIYLVSDMDPAIVAKTILKPAASVEEALKLAEEGGRKTILAMPFGGSTLPKLKQ
jgi:nickel-dependent lactate racemase